MAKEVGLEDDGRKQLTSLFLWGGGDIYMFLINLIEEITELQHSITYGRQIKVGSSVL